MMFAMSDANGQRRSSTPRREQGVLVNLPSTRPQRSTPRRAAARRSAQRAQAARERRAGSSPRRNGAPRQGFESESESMTDSVRPPGGLELAASAAELVGELAKAGLSTGERLLKDALSRLPHT